MCGPTTTQSNQSATPLASLYPNGLDSLPALEKPNSNFHSLVCSSALILGFPSLAQTRSRTSTHHELKTQEQQHHPRVSVDMDDDHPERQAPEEEGRQAFPIIEFLQDKHRQLQELVPGPGAGFGVGCGAGLGLGLVGGLGFDGSPWSHLKLVFGVGMGCGVGVGFGYGQGFGHGASLESLSRDSKRSSKSERRIINL
ncbi:hypothetical protein NL676_005439 [Syzygium grande]|nr:hypothetical protein NL676_005439 [Syzygium grande]